MKKKQKKYRLTSSLLTTESDIFYILCEAALAMQGIVDIYDNSTGECLCAIQDGKYLYFAHEVPEILLAEKKL